MDLLQKKNTKNEKRKKKWCCGLILLSVCVMCVVWTGYYPGSKKRSSQGRPHRTPTQHLILWTHFDWTHHPPTDPLCRGCHTLSKKEASPWRSTANTSWKPFPTSPHTAGHHCWCYFRYFDGLITKRKKKKRKMKKEKKMVLWLDFVICLCYVCSLDRLLSWEQEEEQPRSPTPHPHTAPHSLDSFWLDSPSSHWPTLQRLSHLVKEGGFTMEVHSQHFLKALPNQPPHSWSSLLMLFSLFWWTYYKKKTRKMKKEKKSGAVAWFCYLFVLCV